MGSSVRLRNAARRRLVGGFGLITLARKLEHSLVAAAAAALM